MRLPSKLAPSALALALLSGCTGEIGNMDRGTPGTGNTAGPSGTGGTGVTPSGLGGSGVGTTGVAGATGLGGTGVAPTGSAGATGTPGALDLSGSPKYYRAVRLTNAQWATAVQQVLNLSAPSGLDQSFQTPITGMTAFSNNELVLALDSRYWQDYQSAAEALAAQVTATDAALARVYTGTDAAGFVTTFGRRVYRRPLTTAEQSTYMTLYNSGASLMGSRSAFAKGASLVIRAMLQSPFFLYRTELGAKGTPLNAYEMAAKLSLLLRGAPPDDATLTAAAGTGKFDTADGAAALATTMLGETAATGVMRQFHGEWLHFDEFENISKMGVPTYKASLNAEYAEASFRFFDKIFTQGLGVKEMLLSTSGFYGAGMATFYGVTAPASGSYAEADLGAKRVGFFSQLPYLTLNGMNAEPRSIIRGVTLNLSVLCATLGPPATIPDAPAVQPGLTNRQRLEALTNTCGMNCHKDMINPLGFAFEHFDGMGQWRDTENGGLAIDSSGQYTFADGSTKTWTDAAGLMQALASTPQAHTCYSKKLASYALQRDVVASDVPMLNTLTSSSMAAGGSVKQLIIQLVKHDAFRTHGGSP